MCVAMLIATTFAWFTDTASTSVNKIQAGELKVGLEMKKSDTEWVDAEGQTLNFKKAADGATQEVLWEPGCTYELPAIRVVNNGNLAFKYKIAITGATGDTELLDVIKFTTTFKGTERDLDNWEGMLVPTEKTTTTGTAEEAGKSSAIVISGHMDESAGNNYQGLTLEGISITVYATQYAYEYDSEINTYDLNSVYVFDNYVNVTKSVVSGENTVIQDDETNATIKAIIPDGSLGSGISELALIKKPTSNPSNIVIDTGESAISTDVKIIDTNTKQTISAAGDTYFTISIQLGQVDLQEFYHKGTKLTKVDNINSLDAAEKYFYDFESGVVTFTTKDFSAFTAKIRYSGGDGTADYPYLLSTANDLSGLAKNTNGGEDYSNTYFRLTNDVTLTEDWTPIGEKGGTQFAGTFDGGNFTISGMNVTAKTVGVDDDAKDKSNYTDKKELEGFGALFGAINGGTIKNVTVSGTVSCDNAAGIVSRVKGGTIENCTSNVTVNGVRKAGGIVCNTSNETCTIKNCTNNGAVNAVTDNSRFTDDKAYAGGIVGYGSKECNVKNCTNNGEIGSDDSIYCGGIIGCAGGEGNAATVKESTNKGSVTGKTNAAGIIGIVMTRTSATITDCTNNGTITASFGTNGNICTLDKGATVTLNNEQKSSQGAVG